jgi:hypothetical protein
MTSVRFTLGRFEALDRDGGGTLSAEELGQVSK